RSVLAHAEGDVARRSGSTHPCECLSPYGARRTLRIPQPVVVGAMMAAMSTPPSPPGSPASDHVALVPATIDASTVQAHRGPPRHHRRRIGRPTTLTPRLAKALVKCIAQTGRIEPAARRCGVAHQTVNDWIARGQG